MLVSSLYQFFSDLSSLNDTSILYKVSQSSLFKTLKSSIFTAWGIVVSAVTVLPEYSTLTLYFFPASPLMAVPVYLYGGKMSSSILPTRISSLSPSLTVTFAHLIGISCSLISLSLSSGCTMTLWVRTTVAPFPTSIHPSITISGLYT